MKRIIKLSIVILLFIFFIINNTVYAGYTKGVQGKEEDRTAIIVNSTEKANATRTIN